MMQVVMYEIGTIIAYHYAGSNVLALSLGDRLRKLATDLHIWFFNRLHVHNSCFLLFSLSCAVRDSQQHTLTRFPNSHVDY